MGFGSILSELSDALKKENTQTISFTIQKSLYKWLCIQLFKYFISISKCTSLSPAGNFFGITVSISILFSTSHTLMRWHIIFWEKSAGFSLMFALGGITGFLYRIWIAVFYQLTVHLKHSWLQLNDVITQTRILVSQLFTFAWIKPLFVYIMALRHWLSCSQLAINAATNLHSKKHRT